MKNLQQWISETAPPPVDARDETTLIAAHALVEDAVWVEEGAVEILRGAGEARGLVCHIAEAPCLLGLAELLKGTLRHLESARALGPVRIRRIPRTPMRAVLLSNADILREATAALTERLVTTARAGMLPGTEAETRLAWLLTAYGKAAGVQEGQSVRLPIRRTQAQLARAIGGSERSVNRVITRWKNEHLLDKVFGEHVIYQPAQLAWRAAGLPAGSAPETSGGSVHARRTPSHVSAEAWLGQPRDRPKMIDRTSA